jgi:predicted ATP-dependent serine protease
VKFKCLICQKRTAARFDQCPRCEEWGTCGRLQTAEDVEAVDVKALDGVQLLGDVEAYDPPRILIGEEWDKALGFPHRPGLAQNSIVVVWGKPGSNKTTEMLRACAKIEGSLYLNSEMKDPRMLRMLAKRVDVDVSEVATKCVATPRDVASVMRAVKWQLVVVDSVNGLIPGDQLSAKMMRAVCSEILEARDEIGCALIMIMHATKGGEISAPGWTLHMCDTIVQLSPLRIHVPKNRFGPSPISVKRKRPPLRVVG